MSEIPRGYIRVPRQSLGYQHRQKIKERLTIVPIKTSAFKGDPEPIKIFAEEENWVGVPRGFYMEHLAEHVEFRHEFRPAEGRAISPATPITPRTGQDVIMDQAMMALTMNRFDFGGCILEAKTAAGKTVMGLELARRLGRKTLVIVHTTILLEQWTKDIRDIFPNWKVGRIQADEIDIHGRDVVIGMLQSLAFRDYPDFIYEEFGTILIDEVDRAGAPEFSRVFPRFPCKYVIGMTATLKRRDKAHGVFMYSIGPVIKGLEEVKVMTPIVYLVNTGFAWELPKTEKWKAGKFDLMKPLMLMDLIRNPGRNEIIISNVLKAMEKGRRPLVLTERVNHAEYLAEKINEKLQGTGKRAGVLVGPKKKKERELNMKAECITATGKLVSIGFNEPSLDTLIFASPIQDIDQPVGRILRVLEGKRQPIVVDLVDTKIKNAVRMAGSRVRKYLKKGWKVENIQLVEKEIDEWRKKQVVRQKSFLRLSRRPSTPK